MGQSDTHSASGIPSMAILAAGGYKFRVSRAPRRLSKSRHPQWSSFGLPFLPGIFTAVVLRVQIL